LESIEPFKLKNVYTHDLIQGYAQLVKKVWPPFKEKAFLKNVFNHDWEALELKQRMRHVSSQLHHSLPAPYDQATKIVIGTVDRLIEKHGRKMSFAYGFLADFVERFGLEHPDISIPALEKITQWTSAEFAVRPFLLQYPDRMYAQMHRWSMHDDAYVRRLSSEGIRPRLPWGQGIPVLKKDPSPILLILENLKNDPAETVRRSVANNLNDIAKDHPALVLRTLKSWKGTSENTDWIIKHASRGLLKKGNEHALKLFGFDPATTTVRVENLKCGKAVAINEKLNFSFDVTHHGTKSAKVRLEYAVDYITSTGKTSTKVFQIWEKLLQPGITETIRRFQRFADLTTRKHFPGGHRLSILLNGKEVASASFRVR
jgi:3-methyladenine DNA glycosylase AlkC